MATGSTPYVIAVFDNQKKRTSTHHRNLNPTWHESLEFFVPDTTVMDYEELVLEVHNDRRNGPGARKSHFLGRVKVYGSQFAGRGEEGIMYFALEKKSKFNWIRGEIELKIYYYDKVVEKGVEMAAEQQPVPTQQMREEGRVFKIPAMGHAPPPTLPPVTTFHSRHHYHHHRSPPHPPEIHVPMRVGGPPVTEVQFPAAAAVATEARTTQGNEAGERSRALRRPNGEIDLVGLSSDDDGKK